MNLGDLIVNIGVNLSGLNAGLKKAGGSLEEWSKKTSARLKPFEDAMIGTGAAFGALAVGAGVAIKAFGEFESKLNGVASVSNASASDIAKVREAALKMGADTKFSATEAAAGFYELGKAGFTVNEQLATMPGVVNLAAAAQIGIGEAAETTAGILRGFGLEAGKAGMVADELAQAANASAVDVSDLAESMKYVAPIAQASGQSLEEMNGILAVLGNNMIKGSQAGTSIRSMLVALQKPSDEAAGILAKLGISIQDTSGRMLPLTDIVSQLRDKMAGYTEVQKSAALAQVFGQESLSAVMALMNQAPEATERMVTSMKRAEGAAQTMADNLNKGVNFSLEQLGGSLDTVAVKIGDDLAPAFTGLVDALTGLVNGFAGLNPRVRQAVVVVGSLTGVLSGLAFAIGAVSRLLPIFATGFQALGGAIGIATTAVRSFILAWGPWAAVAVVAGAAIITVRNHLADLSNDLDEVIRKNQELADEQGKVSGAGSAAWAKFSKGVKLTAEEARAATLYLRQAQAGAVELGNMDMAKKRKAQADAMQAMYDKLKAQGPARGAGVADPNAGKDADKAARDALKAKQEALQLAEAQLNVALETNEVYKGGASGQIGALKAYRAEIVRLGATKEQIAMVDLKIVKAQRDGVQAARDATKAEEDRKLKVNELNAGGYAGQLVILNERLKRLRDEKATQDEILDVQLEIARVTKEAADAGERKAKAARDEADAKLQAGIAGAQGIGGFVAGGAQAADQGGVGAVPGFIAGNAETIAKMPQMLMDIAVGLQAALPGLSQALPALAPMFTQLGGSLATLIAGGLAPLLPIVGLVVGAVTLFMLAWQQNVAGIQESFGNFMAAMGSLWEAIVGFFQPVIDVFGTVLSGLFEGLAVVIGVITTVIDVFTAVREAVVGFIMGIAPLRWIFEGIANVIGWFHDAVINAINWIRGWLGQPALTFEKPGPRQELSTNSAENRAEKGGFRQTLTQPLTVPKMTQAVAGGMKQVMDSFSTINPLPVEDQSKMAAFFSTGPAGRFFMETKARVELVLSGPIDSEKLIAATQDPAVRSALAEAVGRENATMSLVPRFT